MKKCTTKWLFFGLLLTVFQQEICADALTNCAQGLQQVVLQSKGKKEDVKGQEYLKLLDEMRKLPQAPKDYPKAASFTADMLLHTCDAFVKVMKNRLAQAQWEENGGTKDYLFVRKLIVPENSVIEFRGDLQGDVHSLIRWLDSLVDQDWFEKENPFRLTEESIKKNRYLAFLGNYTGYGHYGAEVMYIIMQLFLNNPDNVLIVRGYNDDSSVIYYGNITQKLKQHFSFNNNDITRFVAIYEYLPVAMFLGCKNANDGVDFIQCCNGGMEFGYDSTKLLSDKCNNQSDVYEWLDKAIDKKREKIACDRHPDLKQNFKCNAVVSGFQSNYFDFKNEQPFNLPDYKKRPGFMLHQEYTTRLLEDATAKNSKNKVLAVFCAQPYYVLTVQHILEYGNGIYKFWNNDGSSNEIKKGFDWIKQWSGKKDEAVPLDKYSVWTFNVAPRTGFFEKTIKTLFLYDTVARLALRSGFAHWTLVPRQIPVK